MKKIIYFMLVVACYMITITASAQNLSGEWKMENIVKDLGDGVEMHISGEFSLAPNGSMHAIYKTVTTLSRSEAIDTNGKSVYLDLVIDGTGIYNLTDCILNLSLNQTDKSFKIGEGTFDNMGPAVDDPNPIRLIFTAMTDMIADGFKNIDIKNVKISGKNIEGTILDTPVTLTKIN